MFFKKTYNPCNLKSILNKTYITENSQYRFGSSGEFYGRGSLDGVIPELIAGIDASENEKINTLFDKDDREELYQYILANAQKPSKGKRLVFVLNERDSKIRNRIGFKSSPIRQIS